MAKRAAKIAIQAKRELTKGYQQDRYLVLQKLYGSSSLVGGTDPLSVLDSTASDQTFPLMVCLFLPPDSWPKIVQNNSVPAPRDPELVYRVIEQLPSKKECQLLQKMPVKGILTRSNPNIRIFDVKSWICQTVCLRRFVKSNPRFVLKYSNI